MTVTDNNGVSSTQPVTITVIGTNDVPVIGGVHTGDVTEDVNVVAGHISASGVLTITDVDQGQSNFTAQASTPGSNGYGTFTLAADGTWTYTANDSQGAIQQLGAGQSVTDSFTAVSSDGTASQLVTVTITGTNDVPVIGGVHTGSVTEDVGVVAGNISTSGVLTITDVDQGQSNFTAQASTLGSNGYGIFTLAADGSWTYTANDSQTAIQQLGAGQSISDFFTAVSSDGTASQLVTVTIHGTDDGPVMPAIPHPAFVPECRTPRSGTLIRHRHVPVTDLDVGDTFMVSTVGIPTLVWRGGSLTADQIPLRPAPVTGKPSLTVDRPTAGRSPSAIPTTRRRRASTFCARATR